VRINPLITERGLLKHFLEPFTGSCCHGFNMHLISFKGNSGKEALGVDTIRSFLCKYYTYDSSCSTSIRI